MFRVFVFACLAVFGSSAHAVVWSEGGHNLIAIMAFRQLEPEQQQTLITLLKDHPQFGLEFQIPDGITDRKQVDEYLIGRAGFWPDVARKYREFDRPTWHYEFGATKVIGDVKPESDGKVYILEAIDRNRRILSSRSKSASEKALAVCWLAHLVADVHQPCHAGSLYVEGVFPEGDRGANSIKTRQGRNLHALWDQLLGRMTDRRAFDITGNAEYQKRLDELQAKANFSDPVEWVRESRELALRYVYTEAVLEYVQSGDRSASSVLSEEYLKDAGAVAQSQALVAAKRLADMWRECLK